MLLARAYADRIEIQSITPDPDTVEVGPDWMGYVFSVRDPEQPVEIVFDFEFVWFGRAAGEVAVDGGAHVSFSQLVLP